MTSSQSAVSGRVQCPASLSEAQYNLRAAFPHYPQTRERWVALSQALKQQRPHQTHAYGDAPLQTLDYYPVNQKNAPLLVFVHGGYWQGGDKNDVGFLAQPYLDAGINVAMLNYSLAPDARIETMVEEVHTALCWLAQQADTLGFDLDQLSLMGHSAGGHLVAMMAVPQAADTTPHHPVPKHVFPISGVFDLVPLLPSSINDALGLDPSRAEALSPVLKPAPTDSRIHTLVGHNETQQFHEQSAALAQVWQVAAHDDVPDTDHFTILDVLADPESSYCRTIIRTLLS